MQKNEDFIYTKCFDCDKINDIVKVRSRLPGDTLTIHKAGGHKKLKDYFIDEKIPRNLRSSLPLIAFGNEVLWVVGYRSSPFYEWKDEDCEVLYVQVREAAE